MIGAAPWAISLGRFDVQTAIMTMSHFIIAPRIGHLEQLKWLFKTVYRRCNQGTGSHAHYPIIEHKWLYSVYVKVEELIPTDIPIPLGNDVILTHYADANLYHNMVNGRAATGVLHFIKGMPIKWYSKRQATVETATYWAEFVAACIATDQIIDLQLILWYLGVTISGKSHLFAENALVVIYDSIPHSSLNNGLMPCVSIEFVKLLQLE
jgi:hypothetical protein